MTDKTKEIRKKIIAEWSNDIVNLVKMRIKLDFSQEIEFNEGFTIFISSFYTAFVDIINMFCSCIDLEEEDKKAIDKLKLDLLNAIKGDDGKIEQYSVNKYDA